jgi:hypothetical protein
MAHTTCHWHPGAPLPQVPSTTDSDSTRDSCLGPCGPGHRRRPPAGSPAGRRAARGPGPGFRGRSPTVRVTDRDSRSESESKPPRRAASDIRRRRRPLLRLCTQPERMAVLSARQTQRPVTVVVVGPTSARDNPGPGPEGHHRPSRGHGARPACQAQQTCQ